MSLLSRRSLLTLGASSLAVARVRGGMTAASTPAAAEAGAELLAAGGNAMDAAAAAAFALAVTDPPMTSLAGRCQIVIRRAGGRLFGIDGATRVPAGYRAAKQSGRGVAPVPGNPAALARLLGAYGRLPLSRALEPAIRLAEGGFAVTPRLAEIFAAERAKLASDPGARRHFLRSDGAPYAAGETLRQPALAETLRRLARGGTRAFYGAEAGAALAGDLAAGFVRAADLAAYRPGEGLLVRGRFRDATVISLGRHAWGNTLAELLNIASHFEFAPGGPDPREVELLTRIIAQAMEDRPQFLRTLAPKAGGVPLEQLPAAELARERAERIRAALGRPVRREAGPAPDDGHDTTHLSTIDREGNAVALTTSIGPRFGAGVAHPELGFFYAHSYQMAGGTAKPGARDLTEMSPCIALRDGGQVLSLGAAGSERIPPSVMQVLVNRLGRGWPLERSVRAPRVFCERTRVRLHEELRGADRHLQALGFAVEVAEGIARHLGIVHAVEFDPRTGVLDGAADPVYDGRAVTA